MDQQWFRNTTDATDGTATEPGVGGEIYIHSPFNKLPHWRYFDDNPYGLHPLGWTTVQGVRSSSARNTGVDEWLNYWKHNGGKGGELGQDGQSHVVPAVTFSRYSQQVTLPRIIIKGGKAGPPVKIRNNKSLTVSVEGEMCGASPYQGIVDPTPVSWEDFPYKRLWYSKFRGRVRPVIVQEPTQENSHLGVLRLYDHWNNEGDIEVHVALGDDSGPAVTILQFEGRVDHELYIAFRCFEDRVVSVEESGNSTTLHNAVAAAGGYYEESPSGYEQESKHGDLTASIIFTPYAMIPGLTYVSDGYYLVDILQQPTEDNDYIAKVKLHGDINVGVTGGMENTVTFSYGKYGSVFVWKNVLWDASLNGEKDIDIEFRVVEPIRIYVDEMQGAASQMETAVSEVGGYLKVTRNTGADTGRMIFGPTVTPL